MQPAKFCILLFFNRMLSLTTLTSKDNCSNKLSGRKEVSWGLTICTTDISIKSKTSRQPTSNYTKKADRFLCTADRQTFEVQGFRPPFRRHRSLTPFLQKWVTLESRPRDLGEIFGLECPRMHPPKRHREFHPRICVSKSHGKLDDCSFHSSGGAPGWGVKWPSNDFGFWQTAGWFTKP